MFPDFDAVEAALREAGALGEPSEIHGQLCGLACLMGDESVAPWVGDVLADSLHNESRQDDSQQNDLNKGADAAILAELGGASLKALNEANMSLQLLLPDDDAQLETRADCLGHWCRGFLHGLGAAGETDAGARTLLEQDTTREIIEDFSEISRAGFTAAETETEAEAAYAELVEYVRVGVQLFFEELRMIRNGAAGAASRNPS